jgi:carboxymethylenebutenolidase
LTGDEDREHEVADYLDHLPVPVLALYGQDDDLIAVETVDEAQRRNDHGQWLLYEGAGHGFLDIAGDGYEPAAAEDAWARILAFFRATLPPPEIEDLG